MTLIGFCQNTVKFWQIIGIFIIILKITIPIIIIITGIIPVFNVLTKGNVEEAKKAGITLIKKLIAGIIIFYIPTTINAIVNLLVKNSTTGDTEICLTCMYEPNGNDCLEDIGKLSDIEKKEAETIEETDPISGKVDTSKMGDGSSSEGNSSSSPSLGNGSFNLDHAIKVTSDPHSSAHENLPWHGATVGSHAGMIGAYVEAINILHGTDYTLKEIYNKIIEAHPEQKTKNVPVYKNDDINALYHIKVEYAPPTIENIRNALSQGKVVAEINDTDKWRDDNGNFFGKDGRHTGLIFYYDGTHYHMKSSVRLNALYTESQLQDWLDTAREDLIIYSRA